MTEEGWTVVDDTPVPSSSTIHPPAGNDSNIIVRTTSMIYRKLRSLISRAATSLTQTSERRLSAVHAHDFPVIFHCTSNEGEAICAICAEYFVKDDKLRLLPCLHRFHVPCVDEWYVTGHYVLLSCRLDSHMTCPVCRRDLSLAT